MNYDFTLCFVQQRQTLKMIEDLAKAMKTVNYRPELLSYNKRMQLLRNVELGFDSLIDLDDDLTLEVEFSDGDGQHTLAFDHALWEENIIKVKLGTHNDIIVEAPPLGDRLFGNANFIFNLTEKAMNELNVDDRSFAWPREVCVIAKQYGHCHSVAMGLTENREIHAITDTVLNYIGLDDSMWYADFCYCWCESFFPRTEIIITSRENAKDYREYCSTLYELKPEKSVCDTVKKAKEEALKRNIDAARQALLKLDSPLGPDNGILDKDSAERLSILAKSLSGIMVALREPYINGIEHKFSRLFTTKEAKQMKPRRKEGGDHCPYTIEHYPYDATPEELTIHTYSPYTISAQGGMYLCESQELSIFKAAKEYKSDNPLNLHRTDYVAVEIDRYIERDNRKYPDNDNMNTSFLYGNYARRARVIYCRTILTEAAPKDLNCEIHIKPVRCANIPY